MPVGPWIQGPDVAINGAGVPVDYYLMRITGGSSTANRTWEAAYEQYSSSTSASVTTIDQGGAFLEARYSSSTQLQDRALIRTSLVQAHLGEYEGGTIPPEGGIPPGAIIEYESTGGVFVPSTYHLQVAMGWASVSGLPVNASLREAFGWPDLSSQVGSTIPYPVSPSGVAALATKYSIARSGNASGSGNAFLESANPVFNYAVVQNAAITGVNPSSYSSTFKQSYLDVWGLYGSVSGIYTPPRYRIITEEPDFRGIVSLRQRQTLAANTASWPLRQKQNGGATGSWPLRQRQNM